jgi:hypothetical protein
MISRAATLDTKPSSRDYGSTNAAHVAAINATARDLPAASEREHEIVILSITQDGRHAPLGDIA